MRTKREVRLASRRSAEVFTFKDGFDYASFIVDNRGNGYYALAIESSFGNGYAYAWSHPGGCFFAFLAQIDVCYAASKMANDRSFDNERTCKLIREYIIQARRLGEHSRSTARDEWELAGRLGDGDIDFRQWMDESVMFPGDHEMHCMGDGPRARDFSALYAAFWPAFAAECLKRSAEIAESCATVILESERVQ